MEDHAPICPIYLRRDLRRPYGSDLVPGGKVPKSAIKCSVSFGVSFIPSSVALASIRKSTSRFRSTQVIGNLKDRRVLTVYIISCNTERSESTWVGQIEQVCGESLEALAGIRGGERLTRSCRHEELSVLSFGRVLERVDGSRWHDHEVSLGSIYVAFRSLESDGACRHTQSASRKALVSAVTWLFGTFSYEETLIVETMPVHRWT